MHKITTYFMAWEHAGWALIVTAVMILFWGDHVRRNIVNLFDESTLKKLLTISYRYIGPIFGLLLIVIHFGKYIFKRNILIPSLAYSIVLCTMLWSIVVFLLMKKARKKVPDGYKERLISQQVITIMLAFSSFFLLFIAIFFDLH